MSLRFLLGPAGSGKTHACLDEICRELVRDPLTGPPLYFLVPEQATYQMERALLAHRVEVNAAARARVVSFKRLASLVLQDEGRADRPYLDETGKLLALQAVVSRLAGQLKLFQGISKTEGFLEQLAKAFSELRAHRQTPQSLRAVQEFFEGDEVISAKLHDIALLYEAYQQFISERFRDPDSALDLASEAILKAPVVRGAEVWVDGFAGFTPQEYAVLESLLSVARRVTIALCIEPSVLDGDDLESWTEGSPGDLFHPTRESLVRLRELARRAGASVEPPTLLDGDGAPRFRESPLLGELERLWAVGRRPQARGKPAERPSSEATLAVAPTVSDVEGENPAAIEVIEAADPRAEVEAAAREIARAVREDGVRYGEIAVITRELEPYRELIEATFRQWQIPYFLDYKEPAHHHPLVVLIRAALEIAVHGFERERVFRYLKTDLTPLSRDEVDTLENDALKQPGQQDAWSQEPRLAPLVAFVKGVRKLAASSQEGQGSQGPGEGRSPVAAYLELLWQLLEANEVERAMSAWIEAAREGGDRLLADEHAQVWNGIVRLFEELEMVLGDFEATPQEFADVVAAGLKRLRIGRVPPRVDQVVVGSIERSRQPELAIAIILGANEGVFPQIPGEDALFADEERALLDGAGLRLGPDSKTQLLHEQYFVYIALTRASRRLVVLYARADEDGRPRKPAAFVMTLVSHLPGARRTILPARGLPAPWPEHRGGVLRWLSRHLARIKEGVPLPGVEPERLVAAYQWVLEHSGGEPENTQRMRFAADPLAALAYENRAVPLTQELVEALYGEPLLLSPSGLEAFAACPFSFFASSGLRLEERMPYRLDLREMGQISHGALTRFVQFLQREGRDWASLPRDEADALVDRLVDASLAEVAGDPGQLTFAERFAVRRLKKALQAVVWALGEHARRGRFRPVRVEVTFGPRGELPPLVVAFAPGKQAVIQGRIDRVDVAEGPKRYVRIIDYKSSARVFRLDRVVHGLDLQLPLYLAVAVRDLSFAAEPAGFLYQPVFDPLVSRDAPPHPGDETWRRELKTQGLIVDDGVVPRLMDEQATGYSELIPVQFVKSGSVGGRSSVASPEEMRLLLEFSLARAGELAERIASGETAVSPYELSSETACDYCAFKPVCQFDPALAGNRYRRLARLEMSAAWEMIARRVEERHEAPAG